MGGSDGYGHRISDAPGSVRHRLRRLFRKRTGTELQKLGFVPEPQNDMIFSIICEELGLFGATLLILMFMFMIYRFMVIASNAPDLMGSLLVVAASGRIALQVILNIAVVNEYDSKHRSYASLYQLRRNLGSVPDAGDGNGAERLQPD